MWLLPLLAACSSPPRDPDYARPFAVVAAEYAIPIALGKASPGSVGGWDDSVTLREWVRGWTSRPEPHDVDNGFVNYVLHPLSGSETHMIARNHGWSFAEAALFNVAGSVAWEYAYENLFEPPSRIDLLVTAPAGALLGELRWQLKEAGVLPWLVDPLNGHADPFLEFGEEGLLVGVQRRF